MLPNVLFLRVTSAPTPRAGRRKGLRAGHDGIHGRHREDDRVGADAGPYRCLRLGRLTTPRIAPVLALNILVSAGVIAYWIPRISELFHYVDAMQGFVVRARRDGDITPCGWSLPRAARLDMDRVRRARALCRRYPRLHVHVQADPAGLRLGWSEARDPGNPANSGKSAAGRDGDHDQVRSVARRQSSFAAFGGRGSFICSSASSIRSSMRSPLSEVFLNRLRKCSRLFWRIMSCMARPQGNKARCKRPPFADACRSCPKQNTQRGVFDVAERPFPHA